MKEIYRDDPMSIPIKDWVKWIILIRDHYRDNGKGEFFAATRYEALKKKAPYWFLNEERPVCTVIMTDDDVPSLVQERDKTIKAIFSLKRDRDNVYDPAKPDCDGRKTRRTAPEAYAKFDKDKAKAKKDKERIAKKIKVLEERLKELPYSSTLYHIY